MYEPRVSVIVPARDAADTICACVEALVAQRYPADRREIVVVDDGSRDETGAVAARAGARVLLESGRGPGAARNTGVRSVDGEILLFTDADCVPEPDWIARMVAPFVDSTVVATKGAYRTQQRELVARFAHAEYEDKYRRMRGFATIDFVDTYAAAYRRDVFLAAGGFDERFRTNEDLDLSFRLAENGQKMLFIPDARVSHQFPAGVGEYARRKFGVGRWKPLLHRKHPAKGRSDSHTPMALRCQVALAAAAAALAPVAVVVRPVRFIVAAAVLGHLASSVPFASRARHGDPGLAAAVPLLVLLRSYALGLGYVVGWGTLRRDRA